MGRDVVLVSLGRRDRVRGAGRAARRRRDRPARRRPRPARTGSSPRATSRWFRRLGAPPARPRAGSRRTRRWLHDGAERSPSSAAGTYAGPDGACSGYLVADRHHERLGRRRPRHPRQPAAARRPGRRSTPSSLTHEHPDHWHRAAGRCATPCRTGSSVDGHAGAHDPAGVRTLMDGITQRRGADLRLGRGRRRRSPPRSATSASRFSRTDHPVETLAVRVEHGGRVARATPPTPGPAGRFAAVRRPASTWPSARPRSRPRTSVGGRAPDGGQAGALGRGGRRRAPAAHPPRPRHRPGPPTVRGRGRLRRPGRAWPRPATPTRS